MCAFLVLHFEVVVHDSVYCRIIGALLPAPYRHHHHHHHHHQLLPALSDYARVHTHQYGDPTLHTPITTLPHLFTYKSFQIDLATGIFFVNILQKYRKYFIWSYSAVVWRKVLLVFFIIFELGPYSEPL